MTDGFEGSNNKLRRISEETQQRKGDYLDQDGGAGEIYTSEQKIIEISDWLDVESNKGKSLPYFLRQ